MKSKSLQPLAHIWRFFTSIRLALVLIFIIIVLGIISIFVLQAPPVISYNSVEYVAWLENVARPEYGVWTETLESFGFLNVFRSPLFLTAGALLVLNILCCTIRRLASFKTVFRPGGAVSADNLEKSPFVLSAKSPAQNSVLSVSNYLLQHKYRVRTSTHGDLDFISADRYAFSRLGTVISHLSLILLVIGFLFSSFLGFQEDSFILAEGTARTVGHNSGLTMELASFTIDYWPDGTPEEYRSNVTLYGDGQPVKTAAVMVNHPLSYAGLRFYQAFYGPAAVMRVTNAQGETVVETTVSLIGTMNAEPYQRPLGKLDLPGTGLTAYLVAPAINMSDLILQEGELGIELYEDGANVPLGWDILAAGETQEIQGLEFTYVRTASYSGFIIKYDPGMWLVWLALGLFLLGIMMTLYLPYRRLLITVKPENDGSSLYFSSSGRRGFDTTAELERITKEIALLLPRTD
ncbi:MAG: cytochrome c biogenesis protein ResB [Dehalococcoidales bacterium]|jgi:cytochrome c biogenesis protein